MKKIVLVILALVGIACTWRWLAERSERESLWSEVTDQVPQA